MRLKATLLCAVLAALSLSAFQPVDNPMTRAVLKVYEEQLKADPTDWDTWLRAANEYYTHSEYSRALNDVDNALKYIPADNKDDRFRALMLRASIYQQTGQKEPELTDLNSAVAIDPTSYVAIYQRANCLYELERYAEAKTDYKRLQAMNSRSVEALVGQARIAVKENNLGLANEMLDQAVAIDPNNADYYVRRATVRRSMGNHRGAVEDLLLALSTDANNERATRQLIEYSNTNYQDVITGLTAAIEQAPNVAMFVYLRATIAQTHFHYTAALEDYQRILDRQLSTYNGIYASMAQCQLALCRYEQALDNVNRAISLDKEDADRLVLKSQILRALGRTDEAVTAAARATVLAPGQSVPLTELGLCYAAQQKYDQAVELFGEVSMNNPDQPESFMLRAWLMAAHLHQPVAAAGFYNHVADLPLDYKDINSLRGFALLFNGHNLEARDWIELIINTVPDNDGFINFMGACFYAQAAAGAPDAAAPADSEDTARALACMERSLNLGYANRYDWTANNDGRITVAPLRTLPAFTALLDRFSHLFN